VAIAEPLTREVLRPAARRPRRSMQRRASVAAASLLGVVTLVALLAPVLSPQDPLAPGKGGFLLGSDSIGRDLLSRVLYGMRTSWFAALVVIAVGMLVGGLVGLVAGAAGGWVDNLLMRITDGFLALPAPVLAIAVVAALGPSLLHTLVAVSVVWWPFYARIVRGEIRGLAARPHIEAARLAGAGRLRIARRHLLPGASCSPSPGCRSWGSASPPRPRSWAPTPPATSASCCRTGGSR
jgi:peptide/nickel transport system permease protein